MSSRLLMGLEGNTNPGLPLIGVRPQKVDFNTLLKPGVFESPRLLLTSEYEKHVSRKELIEKFLRGGWLTDKQMVGMKPWLMEMLNDFAVELLLHAKYGGIDKLLTDVSGVQNQRQRKMTTPLVIIPEKPKKPFKSKVDVEEVEGDLTDNAKVMTLADVPKEQPKSDEDYQYDGA